MKVKFVTLNIFNGNLLDKCIDFLKKENPDLFVLQEVYRGGSKDGYRKYRSFEGIKNAFNDHYYFFTPEYYKIIDNIKVDSGNVIFSRFQILRQESIYYSGSYRERIGKGPDQFINTPRNLQFAQTKINSKTIDIFNTHGVWGLDGKDNKDRLKMSKSICNWIKDKKNIVLGGDFNLSSNTLTIKNVEKYVRNVFSDELKSTFNMRVKMPVVKKFSFFNNDDVKGFANAVVDMIFVSSEIKVVQHYCPQVDVSDHYPLVAVLEI